MKTIENLIKENKDLILAFHIGRGGRFYNGGHLTFLGERNINEFTEDLFTDPSEEKYMNSNGEEVGLSVNNDGTGVIDIDGEYDATYAKKAIDLDEKEIDAILNRGVGFFGRFAEELTAINLQDIEQ